MATITTSGATLVQQLQQPQLLVKVLLLLRLLPLQVSACLVYDNLDVVLDCRLGVTMQLLVVLCS